MDWGQNILDCPVLSVQTVINSSFFFTHWEWESCFETSWLASLLNIHDNEKMLKVQQKRGLLGAQKVKCKMCSSIESWVNFKKFSMSEVQHNLLRQFCFTVKPFAQAAQVNWVSSATGDSFVWKSFVNFLVYQLYMSCDQTLHTGQFLNFITSRLSIPNNFNPLEIRIRGLIGRCQCLICCQILDRDSRGTLLTCLIPNCVSWAAWNKNLIFLSREKSGSVFGYICTRDSFLFDIVCLEFYPSTTKRKHILAGLSTDLLY